MAELKRDGRPGSDGEHAIQRRLDTVEQADAFYAEQRLDHLNPRMRDFVADQEMFFLATSDRHGECDSSFRAGPPGFLRVVGERTLLFPEYRGNGVHASLGNISENPHAGLLLIDFARAKIGLHINGRARVLTDEQIRLQFPEVPEDPRPGRAARLWVRLDVEEAYLHCAKHIPHLVPVNQGTARDWGTDDYPRKGGDFFGVARGAQGRTPEPEGATAEAGAGTGAVDAVPGGAAPVAARGVPTPPSPRHPVPAAPPGLPDWRAEARRALAEAERRGGGSASAASGGWFG